VFNDKLNEVDQNLIQQRVAEHQLMAQEYERRDFIKKLRKIQSVHPYVTEKEAHVALKECKEDEEEVCVYLTDYFNLQHVRKTIAVDAQNERKKEKEKLRITDNQANIADSDSDDEMEFVIRKRRRTVPDKNRKSKDGKTYIYRKLRLDDAIAQGNFEGWSEARVKAYKLKDVNPNAYYYRFNDPGERQRNGPWTKEEVRLFMERLKELGANGQWGIFSMSIPGRVGYQCIN